MANLSDIFKFISHYRRRGHQIGRKVGDMLEVITYAAIAQDKELLRRLSVEPKLVGFCGAGHKVEFALYALDESGRRMSEIESLLGFIECKKVGVEQTLNGSFKKLFPDNRCNIPSEFKVSFNPQDIECSSCFEIYFLRSSGTNPAEIKIVRDGIVNIHNELTIGSRFIFCMTSDGRSYVLDNSQSLRDILTPLRCCKILEIENVTKDFVIAILNDCLGGPQTPEKAKQASFVALDIRKLRHGSFDKREGETACVSILVITEFAHWEVKSLNMIRASIDYNLVVDDDLLIEAFVRFESMFGAEFLDKITKSAFETDMAVHSLATSIVAEKGARIFKDIQDNKYKAIVFREGKLVVE